MAETSVNSRVEIGISRKNQLWFLFLVGVTVCMYAGDQLLAGSTGVLTLAFAAIAIAQGMRTYIVRTILTSVGVEYRSMFGIWHKAEYSKLLIINRELEGLSFIGEDEKRKNIKINISSMDGNLDAISSFLKEASCQEK